MWTRINQELDFTGFLDVGPCPNFLIPVFADDRALFLQVTDDSGIITAVAELADTAAARVRSVPLLSGDKQHRCAIGQPAIYGFQPVVGEAWLDTQDALAVRLRGWNGNRSASPMLHLEIMEFIGASPIELAHAIKRCEQSLKRSGIRQAQQWGLDQRRRLKLPPERTRSNAAFADALLETSAGPDLLLVHICSVYEFRRAIESGVIAARESEGFSESLAFFFYGRPSFQSIDPDGLTVALALPMEHVGQPTRIYPFDSGAFMRGAYSANLGRGFTLSDFECVPSQSTPQRIVRTFFGNNKAYFRGEAKRRASFAAFDLELKAYSRLLDEGSGSPPIEVQIDRDVLIDGAIAIIPASLSEDPRLQTAEERHHLKVLTYSDAAGRGHDATHIYNLLEESYEGLGAFNEYKPPVDEFQVEVERFGGAGEIGENNDILHWTPTHLRKLAHDLDWDDLRALLLVTEYGGFRDAAERSRLSLNTLRRRIERLESRVGTNLLGRSRSGVVPTKIGLMLSRAASEMAGATFSAEGSGEPDVPTNLELPTRHSSTAKERRIDLVEGAADIATVAEFVDSTVSQPVAGGDVHGPQILVRTLSATTRRDRYGNPWQYLSRSDHHSKVACWGVIFDLLATTPLLRRHVEAGIVHFGINHEMRDFVHDRKKNLDLVLCTPNGPSRRETLADLVDAYDIALTVAERERLASLPILSRAPVGSVLLALEAKACMTAHQRALPRLYDELNSSHLTVHGTSEQAIAVGFAMINAAERYLSPDLNKKNRALEPEWSRHSQPRDAGLAVNKIKQLPRRSKVGDVGYDALSIVVVDMPNDGSPVTLVKEPPAPQAGDIYDYDAMLARLSTIYATRFKDLD
jgi:hypothetical protein